MTTTNAKTATTTRSAERRHRWVRTEHRPAGVRLTAGITGSALALLASGAPTERGVRR